MKTNKNETFFLFIIKKKLTTKKILDYLIDFRSNSPIIALYQTFSNEVDYAGHDYV